MLSLQDGEMFSREVIPFPLRPRPSFSSCTNRRNSPFCFLLVKISRTQNRCFERAFFFMRLYVKLESAILFSL